MTIALSPTPRQAVAIPTTVIHLPPRHAVDFADYLESQNLAETMLEQRVLDGTVLKDPSSDGFFLDQTLVGQASPDAAHWLREHRCRHYSGCRVALYEEAVMDDLLADYQGGRWDDQGYTVIAASALEISIVLELRGSPCLLQLELPTDVRC